MVDVRKVFKAKFPGWKGHNQLVENLGSYERRKWSSIGRRNIVRLAKPRNITRKQRTRPNNVIAKMVGKTNFTRKKKGKAKQFRVEETIAKRRQHREDDTGQSISPL